MSERGWKSLDFAYQSHDLPVESLSVSVLPYVAKVYGPTEDTAKQRAHLIAAAPDMYEALLLCCKYLPSPTSIPKNNTEVGEIVSAVLGALAKAEGKGV